MSKVLRAIFLIGINVVILYGAFHFAEPVRNAVDEWRAERILKESYASEERGDVGEAFKLAKEAYGIAPDSIPVIRRIANLGAVHQIEGTEYLFERLQEADELTLLDGAAWLLVLGRKRDDKKTLGLLEQLRARGLAGDVPAAVRAAEAMEGISRHDLAVALLEETIEKVGDHIEVRLGLGRAELGIESRLGQGVKRLMGLMNRTDKIGLSALTALVAHPEASQTQAVKQSNVFDLLAAHPKADEEQKLAALSGILAARPEDRDRLLSWAVAERRDVAPPEILVRFAEWLNDQEEYGYTFDLLALESVREFTPMVQPYAEALLATGRGIQFEELLEDEYVTLSQSHRDLMWAHYLSLKPVQDRERIEVLLKSTFTKAVQEKRFDLAVEAGRFAYANGYKRLGKNVFSELVATPERAFAGKAMETYLAVAEEGRDEKEIEEVLSLADQRFGVDSPYQDRRVYIGLLLGRELELAEEALRTLPESANGAYLRKISEALARLRLGDTREASRVLAGVPIDKLSDGARCVIAAVYHATGRKPEAIKIAHGIDRDLLLDTERALLAEIR